MLNIIVLAIEVLYYSIYMKFAKKEGKLWQYAIVFSFITLLTLIIGNKALLIYLFYLIVPIVFMKYIFKVNMKLCDFYNILNMLLIKILVEAITYNIFILFLPYYATIFAMEIIKIITLFIMKEKINKLNKIVTKLWNNNNFYIRYFTTIFMIVYIIFAILSIALN